MELVRRVGVLGAMQTPLAVLQRELRCPRSTQGWVYSWRCCCRSPPSSRDYPRGSGAIAPKLALGEPRYDTREGNGRCTRVGGRHGSGAD